MFGIKLNTETKTFKTMDEAQTWLRGFTAGWDERSKTKFRDSLYPYEIFHCPLCGTGLEDHKIGIIKHVRGTHGNFSLLLAKEFVEKFQDIRYVSTKPTVEEED